MKNILIIFSAAIILISCGGNKKNAERKSGFELKGKFSHSNGEVLYLEEMSPGGVNVIDTATLDSNGEFAFLRANPALGFYRVRITDANFAMLILDSTQKIILAGDARNLGDSFTVEGSADSKLFWEVNNTAKLSFQKRDSMMRSYEAYANLHKNEKTKIKGYSDEAEKAYDSETRLLNDYLLKIINKNTSSLVAIVALQQLSPGYSPNGYLDMYEKIDSALTKKYPGSDEVNFFHETVVNMLKTEIGSTAPEFEFENPDGKRLGPSSFRGKVLILDFWASWCQPCRDENPNMVRIYNKYHGRGLEILGVSLDKDKAKWKEAIEKDKLPWNQVSDLGVWQSEAVKLYNVTSIPHTFLLDKDGKIVAKGLMADELEKKLEELLR
jgi:peroxiredoxin